MTVVTETLDLANGSTPRGARVYFRLAGTNGAPVEGEVGSVSIVGDLPVPVLANGSYSVTLYGNDAISPSGTRWKRFVVLASGPNPAPVYINVPSAGGPYAVDAILDEAPASVASSGLTLEIANRVAGDATNATAVTTEATARTTADSILAAAITAETTRATAAEAGKQAAGTYLQGLVPTAVKTANYSAAVNDLVPVDTTSGAVTVTLPTAPADGSIVHVKHVIQGGTNTVTIACGGSDVINKTGGVTSMTLTVLAQAALLLYKASTHVWYVVADDLALAQLDLRFDATGAAAAAQAAAVQRANHTGTQAESTVTGLVADLAAKVTRLNEGLLAWVYAGAYRIVSATRNANEAVTTASVVWPDGSTGTYTADTLSTLFPGATDAYHITYVPVSGPTLTITQAAVTRDTAGAVTAQPALAVA